MNKLHTCLLFFLILIIATTYSNKLVGQVTIGGIDAPREGALLDLKQNDETGVNSTKGLMLPRVRLTQADDITKDIAGVTAVNADAHIGLVVYNTIDEFCGEHPLAKGVHTWSGNLWQYMGPDIKHPEVKEFIDSRDGEKYLYRSFGNEAGVWMLENMRAKRLPGTTTDIELHSGAPHETTQRYGFPSDDPDGWIIRNPGKGKAGLLYNWHAFTNNYLPGNIDQGEMEEHVGVPGGNPNSVENIGPTGTAGKKYVQGICPDGWHIPSDRDWNLIEKEIYNNKEKYSAYTASDAFDPVVWNDQWNWENFLRGSDESTKKGHSYAMLNICSAGGIENLFGKSFPAEYGGFNANITGYFFATGTAAPYEPGMCVFASASKAGSNYFWGRMIFNPFTAEFPELLKDTKVDRYDLNTEAMVAVRCKQNSI